MPEPQVRHQVNNGISTITLANPDNRNALGTQLVAELMYAIDEAEANPETRVIVLTNDGPVFCAGADLSERSGTTRSASTQAVDPGKMFGRFRNSPKPFVGRIAGHAVAGGLGLAAAMDISVTIPEAKFGFTEVRIGVAPAMISVICLPKMRPAEGAAAILRGNRFDAQEAVRLGLINQLVEPDDLDATVAAICADLLEGSPQALAASKQLLAQVPEMTFSGGMEWTAKLSKALFKGPDATEGMDAYLSKRPPSWSPRAPLMTD